MRLSSGHYRSLQNHRDFSHFHSRNNKTALPEWEERTGSVLLKSGMTSSCKTRESLWKSCAQGRHNQRTWWTFSATYFSPTRSLISTQKLEEALVKVAPSILKAFLSGSMPPPGPRVWEN